MVRLIMKEMSEKRDNAGARVGRDSDVLGGGQTRAGHRQVNTCIYRGEMNRMSVVNGRVAKTKLKPEMGASVRARYLRQCLISQPLGLLHQTGQSRNGTASYGRAD